MIPISHFSARTRSAFVALGLAAALSTACLTGLHRAKRDYAAGQEHAAAMRTEQAVASWKKAADVAGRASLRRPSAQSYTVKGLAEANLGRWREAEASFLKAFGLGFAKGESWAADAALAGLAVSFAEFGLEAPALRMYAQILDRSDFRPALMFAAEKRTDMVLAGAVGLEPREQGPGALRAEQGPRPAHRPRLRLRPLPLSPRPGRRPSRRPAALVRGGGHGPRARPPRGKDPA